MNQSEYIKIVEHANMLIEKGYVTDKTLSELIEILVKLNVQKITNKV